MNTQELKTALTSKALKIALGLKALKTAIGLKVLALEFLQTALNSTLNSTTMGALLSSWQLGSWLRRTIPGDKSRIFFSKCDPCSAVLAYFVKSKYSFADCFRFTRQVS